MLYRDLYFYISQFLGALDTIKSLDTVCKESHMLISKDKIHSLQLVLAQDQRFVYACSIGCLDAIAYYWNDSLVYDGSKEACNNGLYKTVLYLKPRVLGDDLMIAAIKGGDLRIVEYLYIRDVELKHKFVYMACVYDNLAIAKYIAQRLDEGLADYLNNINAVEYCINQCHEDVETIQWLVNLGVTFDVDKCLIKACNFNFELAKYFGDKCYNAGVLDVAILEACKSGKIETAKYLKDKGANLYSYGNPALILVKLEHPNVRTLEWLKDENVDMEPVMEYYTYKVDIAPDLLRFLRTNSTGRWLCCNLCLKTCLMGLITIALIVAFLLFLTPFGIIGIIATTVK